MKNALGVKRSRTPQSLAMVKVPWVICCFGFSTIQLSAISKSRERPTLTTASSVAPEIKSHSGIVWKLCSRGFCPVLLAQAVYLLKTVLS